MTNSTLTSKKIKLKFLSILNLLAILALSVFTFVTTPPTPQKVFAFSLTDEPVFVEQWGGLRESENGKFIYPQSAATDSNNNVYVADYLNNRIQKFDSSGNFLTKWESNGSGQWSIQISLCSSH